MSAASSASMAATRASVHAPRLLLLISLTSMTTEPAVAAVTARVPRAWQRADVAHAVVALLELWLYQRGQLPWCAFRSPPAPHPASPLARAGLQRSRLRTAAPCAHARARRRAETAQP